MSSDQGNLFDFPPLNPRDPDMSKLERAFWRFHRKHPKVYATLCRLARQWKARGRLQIGIATLYEIARWTIYVEEKDDVGLKLSNNHRAYYARLIMDTEEDLKDFFVLRKQRMQATIGPDNDTLPPSDHMHPFG